MRRFIFYTLFLFTLAMHVPALAQPAIPPIGTEQRLDVACWNVEWFGSTASGPSNENLQMQNVTQIISSTQIDVWGLEEISSQAAWDTLLRRLPNYDGRLVNYSQTQKTALIWRKDLYRCTEAKQILAVYDYYFADGRLPWQVTLQSTDSTRPDTIVFIVLHLKSNIGSTSEKQSSYDRRWYSSKYLKEYLDQNMTGKKCMVLGDWNDDLDVSIFNNQETPFKNFLTDTADYFFPSLALTQTGQRSTASYNNMIDHQMVTRALKGRYVSNSCKVFNPSAYITSYSSTTSDHYPVYSSWNFAPLKPLSVSTAARANFAVYPVPASRFLYLESGYAQDADAGCAVYNACGALVLQGQFADKRLDISGLPPGLYWLALAGQPAPVRFIKE